MCTHFSFQQAITKLCIRKQKDKPFQLQLIVTGSWDINPVTDIHNFNYKHEVLCKKSIKTTSTRPSYIVNM